MQEQNMTSWDSPEEHSDSYGGQAPVKPARAQDNRRYTRVEGPAHPPTERRWTDAVAEVLIGRARSAGAPSETRASRARTLLCTTWEGTTVTRTCLAVLGVLAAACGGDDGPPVTRVDSAGVEIVTYAGPDVPLAWAFDSLYALGGSDDGTVLPGVLTALNRKGRLALTTRVSDHQEEGLACLAHSFP